MIICLHDKYESSHDHPSVAILAQDYFTLLFNLSCKRFVAMPTMKALKAMKFVKAILKAKKAEKARLAREEAEMEPEPDPEPGMSLEQLWAAFRALD